MSIHGYKEDPDAEIPLCHDWPDAPGCRKTSDLEYTMRFDDIGQPPIYWCEACGRRAREMDKAINRAFQERGSEFVSEFAKAIEKAEGTRH